MKRTLVTMICFLLVCGFVFAGGSNEQAKTAAGTQYKESVVLGDGSQITTGDPQSINNMQHNQISHLKGLKPDVALMQYSKQGAVALSELADAIQPGILIPHHHDLKIPFHDERTVEKLRILRETYRRKLIIPENGEWVEF